MRQRLQVCSNMRIIKDERECRREEKKRFKDGEENTAEMEMRNFKTNIETPSVFQGIRPA